VDPELALLTLEMEILDVPEPSVEALPRFMEAIIAAAGTRQGYSGLAWRSGVKLLSVAKMSGQDPDSLFDEFAWRALAVALQRALQDNRLLSALSYATVSFLPPAGAPPLFDHPQIVQGIRTGLSANPCPFIKPSELGTADPAIQAQFGELLSRLRFFSVDSELLLQWSASALRVLPIQSTCHWAAAMSLLHALHNEKRFTVAYYTFRALAEQHGDLWQQSLALAILQAFISECWQGAEIGLEVLSHLCTDDDDLLRRSSEHFDLLVLVGALAINLTRRYGYTGTEALAWCLVNELFGSYPLVAAVVQNYLASGSLPPLPISRADRLDSVEREFLKTLELVEEEMRPRSYARLTLASKIYQSNIREVFAPLIDSIRSGHCPPALVERIARIDPEELVTHSEWQKSSPNPIDGKILRKMVKDNSRILEVLGAAAQKRIELDTAKVEWAAQPDDAFELFQECSSLLDCLDEAAIWALRTFLFDLWEKLREGMDIAAREREAIRGKRYG